MSEEKVDFVDYVKNMIEEHDFSLSDLYQLTCVYFEAYHQKAMQEGKSFEHSFEMFHNPVDALMVYVQGENAKILYDSVMEHVGDNITLTKDLS